MKVEARCYCGRVGRQMPCYERGEPKQSYSPTENGCFEGSFSCDQLCQRSFDCNVHKCSKPCHAQDELPSHCPYAPDAVTHCPCGKTPLDTLLDQPRQSCEDGIPHCDRPCEKLLPCGHLCRAECHIGDCGFCNGTIDVSCRCGRTSTRSVCHQGDVQQPLCMRTFQANLSCGRHKCGEHCCQGEKRAAERQAARRKNRPAGDSNSIEPEHICIRTCGRPLKCGSHECQQMCHRGPCGSCPEAIFHEISCDCGRTVLQPPQPCGTRPPECRFNCRRRPSCGHPPIDHNCHPDDVACPKCPFLVEKWCACGKEKLQSQPCHLQAAHCGRPCGKKLKCGKLCHRPGECEDVGLSGKHCEQVCGKVKLFCEHPCQNTCHGQTPCNESGTCPAKAIVSCPCGLRQKQVKCLASGSNPTPSRPEIKCDDECLRLDRNRRLAAALNIDPSSHTNDHVPYSDTTLRLFKENLAWAEAQEREIRVFAKSPNEVRMRYKPMTPTCRQFLHVLAEDYGLESRSEDVEPYRYVIVFKGPRFVSAPSKTLAQCVKIRETQAAEATATASRSQSPLLASVNDPFNGLLLTSPRFGLTVEEVKSALGGDFVSQPSIHFAVSFLPTEEVLLRATTQYSAFLSPSALGQALSSLRPRLAKTIERTDLAGNILLCHVDSNEHVSRREDLSKKDAAGWSAVAGRAAARSGTSTPTEEPPARGTGRKLLGLRKKTVDKEEKPWAVLGGDVEC
ncbi:FKBP12-associated protein 1-like protein [Tolypocladium ophioglossoides CBS 100239]|uniref:FKBP12-associated protein 1-like protein n=1 Tax=Tolypocladium ophioglossoides (strain CBS 100239) TaxID=1163406 RepID=A0A0L0NKZ0_TOLOC|nr:FKBP12-associated protein 1-like protein [Tolypocladium ophioglossoides CBS 100239]